MWGKKRSESRSSAAAVGRPGLAARRRRTRRRALVAFSVLLALAATGIIYLLWQPAFRVAQVDVFGTDFPVAEIALASMEGSYFGLAPRNSTFLIPERTIRTRILAAYPTIAAVSVFRKGFTGLTIKTTDRAPVARWCGLEPTPGVEEYCYVFDASGVLFATAAASTTEAINTFMLYAPLEGEGFEPPVVSEVEPMNAKLAQAALLPPTFDFARALSSFGTRTDQVVIRGDEVEVRLASGTRIMYVLGHEQTGYAALVSAKDQLDLASGALDYVDLRFEGKVYIKRKGAAVE